MGFYDVYKIAKDAEQIGESVVSNTIYAASDVTSSVSDLTNMKKKVFGVKKEIIKSPFVKELITYMFQGDLPPKEITATSKGFFARAYNADTNDYFYELAPVYLSDEPMSFYFGAAVISIFEDLYPNIYSPYKYSSLEELQADIICDDWIQAMTLKTSFELKTVAPSFNYADVDTKPLESLPLKFEDNYTKRVSKLPVVSFVLGIVSIFLSFFPGGNTMTAVAGIVTGAIGLKTSKKKALAVWGIVLSALSFVSMFLIAIIGFMSMFNF